MTSVTPPESAQDAEILETYIAQCTNWGRWGDDDECGALNLIGPEQIRHAATLVRQGKSISLTLPYNQHGPQTGELRSNPHVLPTATGLDHLCGAQDPLPLGLGPAKGFGFADDQLTMHTQAGTQWDALAHIFWEGKMWNGRSAAEVTSLGANKNDIENYAGKIVTRGILVDIPTYRNVESLDPGYAITVDDIEDFLSAHDLAVRPGDALLVRTGFMAARRNDWGDYAGGAAPGLSLHTAPWLHSNDIAAVVTDTWGIEVRPNEIDYFQPLHVVALVHSGIAFGEIFDLDALAADCAADGVYEFMFVAPPLPLTGGTGSPVSAVALK